MKKIIRQQLQYGLLISSVMLSMALSSQRSRTKIPQGGQYVASSLSHINLINSDESISKDLLAFMKLFDLTHEGTITSVNKALQTHFLRKPGQERTDIQDNSLDKSAKTQAIQLLRQMSLVDEIAFTSTQAVDYFLLFGAMTQRMTSRTQNFVEQCKKGMECKKVVLLGGVRKLRDHEITFLKGLNIDFPVFLQKLGKQEKELTEADAFRAIWDTHVPENIKSTFKEGKNLAFINSTDVTHGTNNRPTTGATLDSWYDTYKPSPGHCHGNVEMPYGVRMEKVLRTFLKAKEEGFSISWNSPAANEALQMGVYKDELARTFYQECKLKGYI